MVFGPGRSAPARSSHVSASLRPASKAIVPAGRPLTISVAVPSAAMRLLASAYAVSAFRPRIVAWVLLHSP